MMGWFYDDGKDIIEICRVAAYLNNLINPTGEFRSVFSVKVSAPAGYLYVTQKKWRKYDKI